MIEERFAEIGAVAGVTASFICDNSGRVIASSFGGDIDLTPIRDVARELVHTAAVLGRVGESMRELDFTYPGSRLLVRDLDDSLLVVLCESQVEIAMLRLTLNVAATQLKDDSELRNLLQDSVSEREVLENELDQISWQREVDGISDAITQLPAVQATRERHVYTSGVVTPLARKNLEARGFTVHAKYRPLAELR